MGLLPTSCVEAVAVCNDTSEVRFDGVPVVLLVLGLVTAAVGVVLAIRSVRRAGSTVWRQGWLALLPLGAVLVAVGVWMIQPFP